MLIYREGNFKENDIIKKEERNSLGISVKWVIKLGVTQLILNAKDVTSCTMAASEYHSTSPLVVSRL